MRQTKIKIAQLMVITTLIGLISTSHDLPYQGDYIRVNLILNSNNILAIPLHYGKNKCYIELLPSPYFCSNTISQPQSAVEECGAEEVGDNTHYRAKTYQAEFRLGNSYASLQFGVPNDQYSIFYGSNSFCFGYKDEESQLNALDQLFQAGQLTKERVYVGLRKGVLQKQQIVGYLDIGDANYRQLRGLQLHQLQSLTKSNTFTQYSAKSNKNLFYGDKKLLGDQTVIFSLISEYTTINNSAFDDILQAFLEQGVQFYYRPGQPARLNSIDKLSNITLDLIKEDGTPYTITLTPQQYTQKLQDNKYQLLILGDIDYYSQITLGYQIFQSYYVGFDLPGKYLVIGENDLD